MCEWLSSSEWSDVWLQCGGRSFAAHRAVLASVSTFLHQILLSCSSEDSPTFIVLPDFDLDAMSSVLYYIYNGEVVIQKHKLEMFMEIVRAMQIYIDEQYFPSGCKDVQKLRLISDQKSIRKKKVFCLGENTAENYINLKKSSGSDNFFIRKSSEDSLIGDKQRCTDLGTMESACGDRQRSFLRDLFIETYPRNGNVNGRTAGVLAIQNTRYRAPASELLTNANGKHLRVEDTREMHTKSTDVLQNFTSSSQTTNVNDNSNLIYSAELAQLRKINPGFPYFSSKPILDNSSNELKRHLINHFGMHQSQIGFQEFIIGNTSVDLRSSKSNSIDNFISTRLLIDDSNSLTNKINVNNSQHNPKKTKRNIEKTSNNTSLVCSKLAVLNEVLDSPWRPRQPTNYKPFRRKTQDLSRVLENSSKKCTLNDSNNNIRDSPSPEVPERLSAKSSTMEQPFTVTTCSVSIRDFKCAVCDQVFASEEVLSAHARRHSFPARYSCTECSKSFSQLRNFKYHMSVHRGTREFAATCSVCGKYFNDRGYLSSHMKIHRNRKEYKCSQCPKSFNQRVAYNMHVRIHTGVKPHVCSECGKAFSRKMLLKQHQRTHSGERPYACTHCDKRFADRSNMTLHLRLHTGVKPFSCTLCPKSFTKKHHLKSHLNFHTGAKPYSCPKCKLAFTQSSNMRTHLKKCTAPDPTDGADTQSSQCDAVLTSGG